jgi:hypothetical protein
VHRHQLRETLSRLCSLLMERRELKRRVEPGRPPMDAVAGQQRAVLDQPVRLTQVDGPQQAANDSGHDAGSIALPAPEKAAAE